MEDNKGGFTIKKVLWFQCPEPDWSDITLDAYLSADLYYNRFLRSNEEIDLNKFILCLYRDRAILCLDVVENNAILLNQVSISQRMLIFKEFRGAKEELEKACPYAFVTFKNKSTINHTNTLRDTLLLLLPGKLDGLYNWRIIDFLAWADSTLRSAYSEQSDLPQVTHELLLDPAKIQIPKITEISPDDFLFNGSVIDPLNN